MPHSSGGGSSGGGSHSGGSSHSSSGHSSYSGGSGGGYSGGGGSLGCGGFLLIVFFHIILIVGLVASGSIGTSDLHISTAGFQKVRENPAPSKVFDDLGILSDDGKEELTKAMQEYTDVSGISVFLDTIPNSTWQERNSSLSDYAYNKYVALFPNDEAKWLIIYAEDAKEDTKDEETLTEEPSGNKNATGSMDDYFNNGWHFEGIQGDDTDFVLTEELSDVFNDAVVKSLSQGNSPEKAFTYGFERLTKETESYRDEENENAEKLKGKLGWFKTLVKIIPFVIINIILVIIVIMIIKKRNRNEYEDRW